MAGFFASPENQFSNWQGIIFASNFYPQDLSTSNFFLHSKTTTASHWQKPRTKLVILFLCLNIARKQILSTPTNFYYIRKPRQLAFSKNLGQISFFCFYVCPTPAVSRICLFWGALARTIIDRFLLQSHDRQSALLRAEPVMALEQACCSQPAISRPRAFCAVGLSP